MSLPTYTVYSLYKSHGTAFFHLIRHLANFLIGMIIAHTIHCFNDKWKIGAHGKC